MGRRADTMSMNVELLHTTADVTKCDCCGRDDLQRTVKIAVDGKAYYYGTGCAARTYSAQWGSEAEVKAAARKADTAHADAASRARSVADEARRAAEDAAAQEQGYATWGDLVLAVGYAESKRFRPA